MLKLKIEVECEGQREASAAVWLVAIVGLVAITAIAATAALLIA